MAVLNIQNDKDSIETRNCYTVVFFFSQICSYNCTQILSIAKINSLFCNEKKKQQQKNQTSPVNLLRNIGEV